MKCPKCFKEGVRYIEKRKKSRDNEPEWKRTNFKAKCNKCKWEGEIR